MEYRFNDIEQKWQGNWKIRGLTKANLYPTKHPYILESVQHDTGV
jgi:leucyl-tRNA synthetase